MKPHFRWMKKADLPEVMRIEIASFKHRWTEQEFIHTLAQPDVVGMVAEIDNQIVAFMVYEANEDFIDLMNLAVDPIYRRRRIGHMLVNKLIRKARHLPHRLRDIIAKVWERNVTAQLFLKSLGFYVVDTMPQDWDGDDSYVMMFAELLSDKYTYVKDENLPQVVK